MKRKTMAIFAVAAFVILSAVLIQAVDTDAREGDDNDPKYIIGIANKGQELRGGLEARISFNKVAFSSSATVAFGAKLQNDQGDYSAIAIDAQGLVKMGSTGISIGITTLDADDGAYAVKFKPNEDALLGGTILIKMIVTETKGNDSLEQYFYYAANISKNTEITINVSGNAAEHYEYGPNTPGFPNPKTLNINYDQSVKLGLMVQEKKTDGNWDEPTVAGYTFYGTGLPDGLSVTIDGYIGGKLSTTVSPESDGKMVIHAVKDGLDTKLEILWQVGTKQTDEPGFKITIDGTEKDQVMTNVGGSFIVKAEAIADKGTIVSYTVDAKPSDATKNTPGQQGQDNGWTVLGYDGTGTYIVKVSAKMDYKGATMTVVKTFTVYVVGGIYDGNLKPVVNSV